MTIAGRRAGPRFQDPAFRSARKASMYACYNRDLLQQIRDHLAYKTIELPAWEKTYREQKARIFHFDAYGERLFEEYDELGKFYYALQKNRLFYAGFPSADGMDHRTVPLGQFYSKHRLDPLWQSKKTRKFRYLMAQFLEREKWHEQFHPTHLVLTVPHKDGKWKGKTIYIRELIKSFNWLRKERWWKQVIAGGLYNLEVKRNKQNGYHIHLHVLCFQHRYLPSIDPVNYVRAKITAAWRSIVGNDTGYDGIHYSSLYFYETDETGNLVPETNCYWMASDFDPEDELSQEIDMRRWKKRYVRRGDPPDIWIKGIMECLKYNFKPGVLEKEKGKYDIELIRELLANTKGDRYMSKFGNLHNHPGLSLNRKVKIPDEPTEIDEDVLGSAAEVEAELVNPHTGEKAKPNEYIIYVTKPDNAIVQYDARGRPEIKVRDPMEVKAFEPGTTVLEAFRCWARPDKSTREYLPIAEWRQRFRWEPVPETPAPPEIKPTRP